MMLQTPQPLPSNVKELITTELRKAITLATIQVQTAENVAAALAPIRHHKNVNKSTILHIEKTLPTVGSSLYRRSTHMELTFYVYPSPSGEWRTRISTEVSLPLEDASVKVLIAKLQECWTYRRDLACAEWQLECLDDLLDAENMLREMICQFTETRKEVGTAVLGECAGPTLTSYDGSFTGYYHESVQKYLKALTATR